MNRSVFFLPAIRSFFPRFFRAEFSAAMTWVVGGFLALGMSGCATGGGYAYMATIAGGERIKIPLAKGGVPEMAKEAGIQVVRANGAANREQKKFGYFFAFSDERAEPLRSVIVEDVSDDSPVLLVEDLQPKLVEKRWAGVSRLFAADDPAAKWISYANDAFRVFRFTITRADGKKIVLHQGSRVPAWAKEGIRATLGETP